MKRRNIIYWSLLGSAFAVLLREYLVLNGRSRASSLFGLMTNRFHQAPLDLSPDPGRPIGHWLAWAGFTIMCLTFLYSFRKRMDRLRGVGSMKGWLDFHVFAGLLGPLLILFHTNFKIGGLVAIAFWSMVICVVSGLVGRYLLIQVSLKQAVLKTEIERYDKAFEDFQKTVSAALTVDALEQLKTESAQRAGAFMRLPVGLAPIASVWGDLRLAITELRMPSGVPSGIKRYFNDYGRLRRRIRFSDQNTYVMGFWHTFHMPFSIFLWVIAAIHIVVTLLFKVG